MTPEFIAEVAALNDCNPGDYIAKQRAAALLDRYRNNADKEPDTAAAAYSHLGDSHAFFKGSHKKTRRDNLLAAAARLGLKITAERNNFSMPWADPFKGLDALAREVGRAYVNKTAHYY